MSNFPAGAEHDPSAPFNLESNEDLDAKEERASDLASKLCRKHEDLIGLRSDLEEMLDDAIGLRDEMDELYPEYADKDEAYFKLGRVIDEVSRDLDS